MKKLYSLIVLALLAIYVPAFASTPDDTIPTGTLASASRNRSNDAPNITDATSGRTMEVSTKGNAYVRESTKEIEVAVSSGEVIKGSCTVYEVTVTGGNAGELVMLYDAISIDTAGFKQMPQCKLEIEVTTANGTEHIRIPGGVKFDNAVSVKQTGTDNKVVMIQFDNDTRS